MRYSYDRREGSAWGNGEVIESRRWKHKGTGAVASLYGAVPWTGRPGDRKEDWQLENVGWTIRWDNGTIGIGRVPFKTEGEAQEWLDAYQAKREELAKSYRR